MFDIGNQKVDVSCNCGRQHIATLKDVSNGRNIRCSCGVTIQLKDSSGSVRKGLSDINKSMSDFEKALKKLGR
jgi:hypothetical protein